MPPLAAYKVNHTIIAFYQEVVLIQVSQAAFAAEVSKKIAAEGIKQKAGICECQKPNPHGVDLWKQNQKDQTDK